MLKESEQKIVAQGKGALRHKTNNTTNIDEQSENSRGWEHRGRIVKKHSKMKEKQAFKHQKEQSENKATKKTPKRGGREVPAHKSAGGAD